MLKGLLTFFTEHAVFERHLCEGSITLEGLTENTAALHRKAQAAQVQSKTLSAPAVLQVSHNTLFGLHPSVFAHANVCLQELPHCVASKPVNEKQSIYDFVSKT